MNEQQFELLCTMAVVLRAASHRFIGRLAWDPELKTFDSGKCVAKCRLLVNLPGAKRDDGAQPDAFTLELWNDEAQRFVDGLHKGDLVEVKGRVRTNRWTDRKTGELKKELVISVDSWWLVREAGEPAAPAAPSQAVAAPQSKFGGASCVFDGTGDYLSIPANTALDFGAGNFTLEPPTQAVPPAPAEAPEWASTVIPF